MRSPSPSLLIAITSLLTCAAVQAQDSLFYTNGNIVVGQVEEIGVELVRYRTTSAGSTVQIVAEKKDLARIKLQGGQEFVLNKMPVESSTKTAFLSRKNIVGLDILAPALDHFTASYERSMGPRSSLVFKAGYIGLWDTDGQKNGLRDQGFLLKAGTKFLLTKESELELSIRERHPLVGWYLRPDIMFSYRADQRAVYIRDYFWNITEERIDKTFYSSAAVNLVLGGQVLLSDRFSFDIHGGLGYGISWRNGVVTTGGGNAYNSEGYSRSHVFINSTSPLCFSGGMLFGYLF